MAKRKSTPMSPTKPVTLSDEDQRIANVEAFRKTSELVEGLLCYLGIEVRDELTGEIFQPQAGDNLQHPAFQHCIGERLYRIVVEYKVFADDIDGQDLSDAIIMAAGDRMTRYTGPLGECCGITSHNCVHVLLENIATGVSLRVWEAIGEPQDLRWPYWNDLTATSRSNVAAIEREFSFKHEGLSDLASSLRTERILFLKHPDIRPQQPAKPMRNKPQSVGQLRLTFYEDCKKDSPLLTVGNVTRMWCEKTGDVCDEVAFRQSIHRAKQDI